MASSDSHECGLLGALFMCVGLAELSESPELNSAAVVVGGICLSVCCVSVLSTRLAGYLNRLFEKKLSDLSIQTKTERSSRDLVRAASIGDCDEVWRLLAQGGSPNAVGSINSLSALHLALLGGHVEVVKALLAAGADPNIRCAFGRTGLHYAADRGLDEMIQPLVEAGADLMATTPSGDTALHIAAQAGSSVEGLLMAGADPNACDSQGETALYKAVGLFTVFTLQGDTRRFQSKMSILRMLQEGGDPNIQNQHGQSAFQLAVIRLRYMEIIGEADGWIDVIADLIAYGADVDLPCTDGAVPRDLLSERRALERALMHRESIAQSNLLARSTMRIVANQEESQGGQEAIVRPAQRARARL